MLKRSRKDQYVIAFIAPASRLRHAKKWRRARVLRSRSTAPWSSRRDLQERTTNANCTVSRRHASRHLGLGGLRGLIVGSLDGGAENLLRAGVGRQPIGIGIQSHGIRTGVRQGGHHRWRIEAAQEGRDA